MVGEGGGEFLGEGPVQLARSMPLVWCAVVKSTGNPSERTTAAPCDSVKKTGLKPAGSRRAMAMSRVTWPRPVPLELTKRIVRVGRATAGADGGVRQGIRPEPARPVGQAAFAPYRIQRGSEGVRAVALDGDAARRVRLREPGVRIGPQCREQGHHVRRLSIDRPGTELRAESRMHDDDAARGHGLQSRHSESFDPLAGVEADIGVEGGEEVTGMSR